MWSVELLVSVLITFHEAHIFLSIGINDKSVWRYILFGEYLTDLNILDFWFDRFSTIFKAWSA